MQLGEIAEDRLSDLDRAALAFERASNGPEPRPALAALERVLVARRAGGRSSPACCGARPTPPRTTRRPPSTCTGSASSPETTLGDPRAAIAAYREVLELAPAHPQARAARSSGMLAVDRRPSRRAPRSSRSSSRCSSRTATRRGSPSCSRRGSASPPMPIDRAGLLQRLVELSEQRARRPRPRARRRAALARRRLRRRRRRSPRSSGSPSALGQWRRGRDSASPRSCTRPDAAPREPDTQVALLVFLGRVQRERLGQLDEAAASYRAALALDPEAIGALDDADQDPPPARRPARRSPTRCASAAARSPRSPRSAPRSPRSRSSASAPATAPPRSPRGARSSRPTTTDRAALDELARIYRQQPATPPELIETSATRPRARGRRRRTRRPARRDRAARERRPARRRRLAGRRSISIRTISTALASLEAAYARAGDWMAVSRHPDAPARSSRSTTADKVAIHAEMARLAEHKRGSVDDAIASWYAALDVDGSHRPALRRARAAARRGRALARSRRAARQARRARRPRSAISKAELAALARAADVWEAQARQPGRRRRDPREDPRARARLGRRAHAALEDLRARRRLGQVQGHARAGAQAVARPGRDAADLFFRLGEVARAGRPRRGRRGDRDPALPAGAQARPGATPARSPRSRSSRATGATPRCSPTCCSAASAPSTAPAERVALLVELAELERKAGRNDAALAALARAAQDAPEDARVLGPLADLYFAAGRLDEAAPIYDRLAEDAKAGRRMKDVARFRQRQGGILEARGDRAGALAAYEEALRVNPTDVTTMTGLGRLYFAAEDWEKARKIYQSLVLQNIDADAGVTKGEVYWALGKIHLAARPAAEGQEHVPARPRDRAEQPEAPRGAGRAAVGAGPPARVSLWARPPPAGPPGPRRRRPARAPCGPPRTPCRCCCGSPTSRRSGTD